MILLWFILGMLLILGIARYNESNKLFWTLSLAYVMGFAGAKMVLQTIGGEEQSNVTTKKECSMQVPAATLSMLSYYVTSTEPKATNVVTAHKPAGQSITPLTTGSDITLSEVFGGIRDQPQIALLKPPELWSQKDFSTPHERGG